jgi:multidrug efflux pump subunit AcrB
LLVHPYYTGAVGSCSVSRHSAAYRGDLSAKWAWDGPGKAPFLDDIRNTLPQDIVGPGFNDEFGDTYGIVYGFTADGFTGQELRDRVVDVRKHLLQLPDVSNIDILGAQDERVYVEFSTEQLAGLGIDRADLIAALQAQNAVTPAGVVQTADKKIRHSPVPAWIEGGRRAQGAVHDAAGRHRRSRSEASSTAPSTVSR